MTDNDTATKRRDEQPNATMPGRIGRGPRRWSTPAIVAGAFACAIALGAGGYAAIAATDPTGLRQGLRLVFVQQVIGRALDSVGASAEQENKVHDIVAAKFAEIAPDPEEHGALRRRALELLGRQRSIARRSRSYALRRSGH